MYVSRDGHWRVSVISLDNRSLLRIEHDQPVVSTGGTPVATSPGWFWAADVRDVSGIETYVPLGDLQKTGA
jgi:hypothetical protein